MDFAEFLKSQGASADDIKALTEGSFSSIARRAYEKLQADATAASAEAEKQAKIAKDYEGRVNSWFDEHDKEFKTVEQKLVAESARAAKAEAALRVAHERGMIDVAKDLGYNFEEPPKAPPKKDEPLNVDTSKFLTVDRIKPLLEDAGNGFAVLQDMVLEHMQLFPNQVLHVKELRDKAVAAGKTVHQYWLETFKVEDARKAREAAAQTAHDDKIRKEERERVQTEFASKYGSPETRPLVESKSPFTPRPAANREKQPWETGYTGEDGSNDRVRRATQTFLKSQTVQ
jgi:hypothetical protein